MKNISSFAAIVLLVVTSGVRSFAQSPSASTQKEAIYDTVVVLKQKGFNIFFDAVATADLAGKLKSGAYTVVAPTDVAFRDLPKQQLDALLADKEKLAELINHHLIEGKVSSSDLKSGNAKTVAGTTISAKDVKGKLKIGNATLVRIDIPTANGLVHGVDKFLP